jgi:hypothetical protein
MTRGGQALRFRRPRRSRRTSTCPRCQSQAIPIGYGMPGPEMVKAADRGEIHIGGCMPGPALWHCTACRHEF